MRKHIKAVLIVILVTVIASAALAISELSRCAVLDGWLIHGTNGESLVITREEACVAVSGNHAVDALLAKSENGSRVRLFYGKTDRTQPVKAFGGFCYGKSAVSDIPAQPMIELTDSGRIDGCALYEIHTGWFWYHAGEYDLLTESGSFCLTAETAEETELLHNIRIGYAARCICRKNADDSRTLCAFELLKTQEPIPQALLP